ARAAFDQRFDPTETGRGHENLAAVDHPLRSILSALCNEREHGAEEAPHLPLCSRMPRMGREPRIVDMLYRRVSIEPPGQFEGVLELPFEPHCQRLRTTPRQPTGKPVRLRPNIATTTAKSTGEG